MLRKLLKYDLIATGRVMVPLLAVLMLAFLAMGLNIRFTTDGNLISIIIVVVFVLVTMSFGLIAVVFMLSRFYKNLLGQEGYLMFSLPVTTMQNVLSKSLTSIFWVVISLLVGLLSGLIMVEAVGEMGSFREQLDMFFNLFKMSGAAWRDFILYTVAILLAVFKSISEINAAMALGHEWQEHRMVGSVLAYAGFAICELVLTLSFARISGKSIGDFMVDMANGNGVLVQYGITISSAATIMVPAIIGIIVYNLLTWWLLDKKLNLQ